MTPGAVVKQIRFRDMYTYQTSMELSSILLNIESTGKNTEIDFVVMVYQEASNFTNNAMIIYDIETQDILKKVDINPDVQNQKYMYFDD